MTTTQTAPPTVDELTPFTEYPEVIQVRDQLEAMERQNAELSDKLARVIAEIEAIDADWQNPDLDRRVQLTLRKQGIEASQANAVKAIESQRHKIREVEWEVITREMLPIAKEIYGALFRQELEAWQTVLDCLARRDQFFKLCDTTGIGTSWHDQQHRSCKPPLVNAFHASGMSGKDVTAKLKQATLQAKHFGYIDEE